MATGVANALEGSVAGTIAAEVVGDLILPGIGAVVGAALGDIAGTLISDFLDDITGGWFSGLFEDHPWVYQFVDFNSQTNDIEAPTSLLHTKRSTPQLRDGVASLTNAYLSTVNSVITEVGGRVDPTLLQNSPNPSDPFGGIAYFAYEHDGQPYGSNEFKVIYGGGPHFQNAADDLARIVRMASSTPSVG